MNEYFIQIDFLFIINDFDWLLQPWSEPPCTGTVASPGPAFFIIHFYAARILIRAFAPASRTLSRLGIHVIYPSWRVSVAPQARLRLVRWFSGEGLAVCGRKATGSRLWLVKPDEDVLTSKRNFRVSSSASYIFQTHSWDTGIPDQPKPGLRCGGNPLCLCLCLIKIGSVYNICRTGLLPWLSQVWNQEVP